MEKCWKLPFCFRTSLALFDLRVYVGFVGSKAKQHTLRLAAPRVSSEKNNRPPRTRGLSVSPVAHPSKEDDLMWLVCIKWVAARP